MSLKRISKVPFLAANSKASVIAKYSAVLRRLIPPLKFPYILYFYIQDLNLLHS